MLQNYFSKKPSNDRNWSKDQAVLPRAEFSDTSDRVTVHDIRDFSYTTTEKYTEHYETATFDISKISSVEFALEPFGKLGAAHTFLTFGFEDGEQLAISPENRKKSGDEFSVVRGLFREYELMYVVARERDIIKLRTNFRKHHLYLYPLRISKTAMQKLFRNTLRRTNYLFENPEFYNTLTNSCTTNLAALASSVSENSIPWNPAFLLPANADKMLHRLELLDPSLSISDLRGKYEISERAQKKRRPFDVFERHSSEIRQRCQYKQRPSH